MMKNNNVFNKFYIVFLLIYFLIGCAIHANIHDEVESKEISPPLGHALIYFIRAAGFKAGGTSLTVSYGNVDIGKIWSNQYLYAYATPKIIKFRNNDGSIETLNIKANNIYYLLYGYEEGFLEKELSNKNESIHYRLLTTNEGRSLISSYRLSGDFKRVVIGDGIIHKYLDSYTDGINNIVHDYIYDDKTRIGSITVNNVYNLRNEAITTIKEICRIKNIALTSNNINRINSATFTTLDEKLYDNNLYMKFECLY